MSAAPVQAVGEWRTNGELIADVARLGYLDGHVLDVTYGLGRFWTEWRPARLTAIDLDPTKSPSLPEGADFRTLPYEDRSFDAVVIDPPYRFTGTADQPFDGAYGLEPSVRWQDRMQLILDGVTECCRVSRGFVLAKVQAQVVSGRVRWQDVEVVRTAETAGWRLVDRFDLVTPQRKQPTGRRQVHARRNHSTLLVLGGGA
jgi:hypothetical protein